MLNPNSMTKLFGYTVTSYRNCDFLTFNVLDEQHLPIYKQLKVNMIWPQIKKLAKNIYILQFRFKPYFLSLDLNGADLAAGGGKPILHST
jgi:hypothetical protein